MKENKLVIITIISSILVLILPVAIICGYILISGELEYKIKNKYSDLYLKNEYNVIINRPSKVKKVYKYELRDGIDFYIWSYSIEDFESNTKNNMTKITKNNINQLTDYYLPLLNSYFKNNKEFSRIAYWNSENELIDNYFLLKEINARKKVLMIADNESYNVYVFFIINWQ